MVRVVSVLVVSVLFEPFEAMLVVWNVALLLDAVKRFVCFDSAIKLWIKQLMLKQVMNKLKRIFRIILLKIK